jgi:hypothetical protein
MADNTLPSMTDNRTKTYNQSKEKFFVCTYGLMRMSCIETRQCVRLAVDWWWGRRLRDG